MNPNNHIGEHLAEYALGTLPPALVTVVEEHLPACERCARELSEVDEALASVALEMTPVPPPAHLWERLNASIAQGTRFERFVARLGEVLSCAQDKARELLARIDDAAAWVVGPGPSQVIHLDAGPATAAYNVGFVRVPAGEYFPKHRHEDEEHVVILQGGLRDSEGVVLQRGDENVKPGGSSHSFHALDGHDLIYLVVLKGGLVMEEGPSYDL